jgi:polysaccharide pyruvyl transferase WcaK-like protein
MKPLRLIVVADVGGPGHYHLGDEAMLEANLHMVRQLLPSIEFTVPSRDPVWTGNRYGVESFHFPQIPHSHTPESWTRKLAETPDGSGAWAKWLGEEITEVLRHSAGLMVSGGGNLCATWPDKVLERVALMEHARELGIPAVMLGQTLGPALSPDQRRLLAGPLQSLGWVGVRDESSVALASALGVSADRLHKQLDDAFFLDVLAVEDERAKELKDEQRPWIVVTLDSSFGTPARERTLSMLASQLDALADCLEAALVFVPHVGGADTSAPDDTVAGRALSAKLRSKLLFLGLWQPREVRWLIEQAAMVVSTRYHPLVFATAAGVPSLGIHSDDYTRIKLRGALAAADLQGWCLSVEDAERGALLPLARELWHQRNAVRDRLAHLRSEAWPRELRRWDEICRALCLESQAAPDPPLYISNRVVSSSTREQIITNSLSEEQWWHCEQNGYLRLGRVLDETELAALQERIDGIMLGRVRYPTLQMQLDTGGAYEDLPETVSGLPEVTLAYRKVQGLESDPLVLELIRRDLFRDICGRHYGKHSNISIFRVMLMNKPAGKGTYLPWHQDAGAVWKLDRDPLVTLWVALDPATKMNGCVQVIPGSHRLGLLSKNGSTISPAHAQMYCPDDAIEYLELEAGEAVLLHNWLLHRSDVNHTGAPRRALTVCYMDGRTLNTLTGTRFPVVFGENEDAEYALPFLRDTKEENRQLREMFAEAERYAKSLLDDNQQREQMRRGAERYAKSLEKELSQIRGQAAPATAS